MYLIVITRVPGLDFGFELGRGVSQPAFRPTSGIASELLSKVRFEDSVEEATAA